MNDLQQPWGIQEAEHAAWVHAMKELRAIGLDVNSVDWGTFGPSRRALHAWALVYAEGRRDGVFSEEEA